MTDSAQVTEAKLLEERAQALARPLALNEQISEAVDVLEIQISGARYAVELSLVEATLRIGSIFSVPLTRPHFSGIIWRHGQSIALVNLRNFFHPQERGIADADTAVIVYAGSKRFALQVEDLHGVRHLAQAAFADLPETFDSAQQAYLKGITGDGLALLDLERLVEAEDFAIRDSTIMTAAPVVGGMQ